MTTPEEKKISQPVFGTRSESDKYMVRFWSSKPAYKAFTAECDRQGLKYGDVFHDFIQWFVTATDKVIKEKGG